MEEIEKPQESHCNMVRSMRRWFRYPKHPLTLLNWRNIYGEMTGQWMMAGMISVQWLTTGGAGECKGMAISIDVPVPSMLLIWIRPFKAATRSRIPINPNDPGF